MDEGAAVGASATSGTGTAFVIGDATCSTPASGRDIKEAGMRRGTGIRATRAGGPAEVGRYDTIGCEAQLMPRWER